MSDTAAVLEKPRLATPEAQKPQVKKEAPKPIGPKEQKIAQKIDIDVKAKADPDKILQEIAGGVLAELPPVPEGMTRLYRYEEAGQKFVVTPDNVEAKHVNPVPSGWALVAKEGNGQFSGQVVSGRVNFDSAEAAIASIPEIETGRWFTKERGTLYGLDSATDVPRDEFYIDVPTPDLTTYGHNPELSHIPEHMENEFLVPAEVARGKLSIPSSSARVNLHAGENTQEITETPENQTDSFGRISENISALVNRIKSGEGDVEQAKQVLGKLLQAREDLYRDVAQAINPDIQPVEEKANLYRIAGTEIYGSIISVMDATPALGINRQLAERIKMKLPANGETISGENLPPKALMEASVVFSGSSAQDRIQHYPGDRDMQEYVRIQASTPEEAASILARGIQGSVDQKIEIVTSDGEKMTLNFSEMKLGGTYPEDAQLPSGDLKIRWTAQEVKQGYKEYKTKSGEVKRIALEQACLNPQVLKVDYIGVTEDSVMEVTKQTIIQNTPEKGDDSMTNDPGQASAFQEVYFDNPSTFGLIEMTYDPDKFVQYVNIMAEQVKAYSKGDHMNGLKVAKRLYNLAKAEGNTALSQEVAQIFGTDATKANQLVDRLNVSMLAQKKGIDVSSQQTAITGQLRELLAGSTSPLAAEALAILDQGEIREDFDKLRGISVSIVNSEYQKFLSEHPKVAAKISAILGS